jgi:hypothetical protein
MNPFVTVAAAIAGAAFLPAQTFDMIGVAFSGQILRIDSATGATALLGSGQLGKNCLAIDADDRIWTNVRTGTVGNFQFFLAVIDPLTGAETLPFGPANVGDIRGLAFHDGLMYGVRDAAPSDELVRIDLATGAVTPIGPMGFTGVQGLDDTGLGLRAWDLNAGLLQVDPGTGAATDPFGSTDPTGLQWMATEPGTADTYVGRSTVHQVNLSNGSVSGAVSIAGAPDLRGVEFTNGRFAFRGSNCAGVRIAGAFQQAPFALLTRSNNHGAGAFGVQIVGLSATSHQGQPLPLDLDPLLGTQGCSLNVSIDATVGGVASATGILGFTTAIPPGLSWIQLFVQHAAFDPVPGGTSWSHGLQVRTPL